MTYLEEIRRRSILLWQSLFGAADRAGDGDGPVHIDGSPAAGRIPAAGDGSDAPASGDGVPPPEVDAGTIFDRAPAFAGASGTDRGAGTRPVRDADGADGTDQDKDAGPGADADAAAQAGPAADADAETDAEVSVPGAASLEELPEALERVLRGVETDTAVLLRRQTAAAARENARRQAIARPAKDGAETEDPSGGVPAAGTVAGPSGGDADAFVLLAAVRQAERAADSASVPGTPPRAAAEERVPSPAMTEAAADAGDWSLAVERDARRYDGSCEIL